ncbi:hypothetical protein PS903_02465 [Pseudomonas fluorescens]|nr:hypothetical protein PS903_02465 [Pseudomonas fluorescens]
MGVRMDMESACMPDRSGQKQAIRRCKSGSDTRLVTDEIPVEISSASDPIQKALKMIG